MSTAELIAKLWIWQQANLPENELITLVIERLEQLNNKVAELDDTVEFLLHNQAP